LLRFRKAWWSTGRAQDIHVVLDNLSAHKTKEVQRFLAEHPQVRFPSLQPIRRGSIKLTSGSPRSNAIRRSVFTSVADLEKNLRRY
jgi:hypothetical protein